MLDPSGLDFGKGHGLITVVAQHADTGVVLMVAHMDREALERTLASGEMHYFSRTRGPWHKGGTSGNTQYVVSLTSDCDGDALLARVLPRGPTCHTGSVTCFSEEIGDALAALDQIIAARAATPPADGSSYTARLLGDRNLRLKKLGEEAAELIAACADGDSCRAIEEAADLLYHALVALRATGGSLADVRRELEARARATDTNRGTAARPVTAPRAEGGDPVS